MEICQYCFEEKDPTNPYFSLTEIDLAAKHNCTIRKNFAIAKYEIVKISDIEWKHEKKGQMVGSADTLQEIVSMANCLEAYDEPALVPVELCDSCKRRKRDKFGDMNHDLIDIFGGEPQLYEKLRKKYPLDLKGINDIMLPTLFMQEFVDLIKFCIDKNIRI